MGVGSGSDRMFPRGRRNLSRFGQGSIFHHHQFALVDLIRIIPLPPFPTLSHPHPASVVAIDGRLTHIILVKSVSPMLHVSTIDSIIRLFTAL